MSALFGFFKGYNDMGEALQNERLARLRAGVMQNQLDQLEEERALQKESRQAVMDALANRGVHGGTVDRARP